ncbi:MAG TPA: hypothetical protein DCS93_02665 [Microscillaceae bacterium]|nr:hypothetical protein [Microscillaceae bacterium]
MKYLLISCCVFFLITPLVAQQQAAERRISKKMERALKVICPQNDDICKLLKELQIKVNRFNQQEAMDDTEGLFADVEGIKYVFNLIEQRYKKLTIKPLELTHFIQSKYSFIVIYLHSYLDKYRKDLISQIEQSWKERKQLFAQFKTELESANPNRNKLNGYKSDLAKVYQKLATQNTDLKEMYETLVPVYTELSTKEKSIENSLQTLKEKIAEQNSLIRKIKQDLEKIPLD